VAGEVGGGDLEGGHVERGEQVYRLVVERGGEGGEADVPRVPEERLEIALRELVEPRERVPLRALGVRGLHPVAGSDAGRDLRGGVALELDRIRPGGPRALDELVPELHVAVVVHPRLRDHVAGMPLAHHPPVDRELARHR
jgi:hypothetical protein